MDVVIRTPHGEAEITIARAGEATAIADIVGHRDRKCIAAHR